LIALKAISVVTAIDGRLASVASCCATRTSLDRVEITMALAHHRVRNHEGRHESRDAEHVKQNVLMPERC
jgi:hypothetical protein